MLTYMLIDLGFIAATALLPVVLGYRPDFRSSFTLLIALLIMTIIFDNLIISLHIVGYNSSKLLRIYLGRVPIEDLGYVVAAVILIPLVWDKTGNRK